MVRIIQDPESREYQLSRQEGKSVALRSVSSGGRLDDRLKDTIGGLYFMSHREIEKSYELLQEIPSKITSY